MEVSKRNSNEDIQRLCFRSVICKEFQGNRVKTMLIIPSFNTGNGSSLKRIGLLIRFFDIFLFEEDLELLPGLLNLNTKEIFLKFIRDKLVSIQPDFGKILDLLKNNNSLNLKEISEITNLPLSRIRNLIKNQTFNLQTLGLIECLGNICRLNEKFLG